MNRKNGFTLIELLAVIVILAVIALIATPLIMGVINNAKKGAAKDSAFGYMKAVELSLSRVDLKEPGAIYEGDYDIQSDGSLKNATQSLKVGYKGTSVTGRITIKDNEVTTAKLVVDTYAFTYDGKNVEESTNTPTPTPIPTPAPVVCGSIIGDFGNSNPTEYVWVGNRIIYAYPGTKDVGNAGVANFKSTYQKGVTYVMKFEVGTGFTLNLDYIYELRTSDGTVVPHQYTANTVTFTMPKDDTSISFDLYFKGKGTIQNYQDTIVSVTFESCVRK